MVPAKYLRLAIAACLIVPAARAQSVPTPQDPAVTRTSAADIRGSAELSPSAAGRAPLTTERRADVSMARKRYREAIEIYKQVPEQTAVIWNKIGIAYHQMTELGSARKHYRKSIKLDPTYAEARNNLGAVYYANRSYRRAIKEYNRALKLSPYSASIYSNLGTAFFARRKYKKAFAAYQQALALDPDVFEHRSTYGVLLQERTVQERAKFHFYLAKTYAAAGISDRALIYIRKSLEEGFKDRKKYVEDPAFASLQELPEFHELMAMQPRVL
jgi:tetratricopeptide (TPR) repeat protein